MSTKEEKPKKEPTVWIIQSPTSKTLDLSSASRYGRIETIIAANERPSYHPGPTLTKLTETFKKKLNYLEDYLLWTLSDPVSLLLTGVVLERLRVPSIKLLRWENERDTSGTRTGKGFYVPTSIILYR